MKIPKTILLAVLAVFGSAQAGDDLTPGMAWRNPIDGMHFVWIPEGTITCQTSAAGTPQRPSTNVPGFWMGRTEATVAQFRRFVAKTGYVTEAERATNRWTWKYPGIKQRSDHPVVFVSSNDAMAYALWAGADLPTESEWLHASGAVSGRRYHWGDELDDRFVWHRENAVTGTRAVAKKLPNGWGLYDMVGNAWEYCKIADCLEAKQDHQCFSFKGSSWARCPSYLTRQGTVAENLIADGLDPRLSACGLKSERAPYPWNDDRGFRCVKRPGRTVAR